MSDEPRAVPALLIERLHLGELDAAAEARLRATHGDGKVDAALRALAQSDGTLAARFPADTMTAAITARVAAERRGRGLPRWLLAGGPAVAALAALLWIAQAPAGLPVGLPIGQAGHGGHGGDTPGVAPRAEDTAETVRLKGDGPRVRAYRRRDNPKAPDNPFIEALQEGATVRPGDVLQLGYSSPTPHGALLSLDGRGAVTLLFPARATQPARLPKASGLLDFAYELDDSPDFERFYLITADGPFELQPVMAALRAAVDASRRAGGRLIDTKLQLDKHAVATLTLHKVKP